MSNAMRRIISVLGLLAGFGIIYIGFDIVDSYFWTDTVGSHISFGADFYTEIYDVTRQVGNAVVENTQALERLYDGIGWLIISIGAVDVFAFAYLLFAPKRNSYKKVFGQNQEGFVIPQNNFPVVSNTSDMM